MRTTLRVRGRSITGRRRHNEDALLLAPEAGVFAVLDGMGGYAGGDLASSLAATAITRFYSVIATDPEATWPYALDPSKPIAHNCVDAAIRLANRSIRAQRVDELGCMGSTVALLSFADERVVLGHLGDSRIYRLRAGALTQLTRDHSLYEQLLGDGVPLPSLAEFPYANVITRALGPDDEARPELAEIDYARSDRFLLCTDGLSGALDPDAIAALLDPRRGDPEQACDGLIDAAFAAGSRDNITAIVIEIA